MTVLNVAPINPLPVGAMAFDASEDSGNLRHLVPGLTTRAAVESTVTDEPVRMTVGCSMMESRDSPAAA
jgi:hypothetical protein